MSESEFDYRAAAARILARAKAKREAKASLFEEVKRGDYVRFLDDDGQERLLYVLAVYPIQAQLYGQQCECLTRSGRYVRADQLIGFFGHRPGVDGERIAERRAASIGGGGKASPAPVRCGA